MEKSSEGLVPARNFLERCMAGRREFDDGVSEDMIEVRVADSDGAPTPKEIQSLRTPKSSYGKRIR